MDTNGTYQENRNSLPEKKKEIHPQHVLMFKFEYRLQY